MYIIMNFLLIFVFFDLWRNSTIVRFITSSELKTSNYDLTETQGTTRKLAKTHKQLNMVYK